MSGLPKGWVEATLEDLCEFNPKHDPETDRATTVSFIPMPAVDDETGAIVDSSAIRPLSEVWKGYTHFADADVIFAKITPCMENGKIAVARDLENGMACGSTEFHVLRSKGAVKPDFVWRFLRQRSYRQMAERSMTGAVGQRRVPKPFLEGTTLPLPPLAEQKRIVAKLDALNAKSARARTELARIETLVSRYKQAVLRSAFLGAMTSAWRTKRADLQTAFDLIDRTPTPPQPKGGREATDRVIQGKAALAINAPARGAPPKWRWVPLSRIARQETGHTPSRSHPEWWDGEIPWIGIKDAGANHGRVIEETIQTTNEEGLANSAARLLPAGTVCLSRTASVGYVTIMGKPMATSQDFVTWTCTEALVPKFLMYALMAEGDDIREFGKGTTHTTIYFPEVRAMQICLAPLEEQHEIVRRIETAFAKIDRLAREAKRALELLGRLDEAILAKAFRGELVPQDENDESAEHVLARIRAERQAAPKGKSGRGARG